MTENRKITLVERPRYSMPTHNCFKLEHEPVPRPDDNELLIRTLWLSLDPYLHGRMKRISVQAEPVPLGEVMVGATVGRVEESNHPGYEVGGLVVGFWGWQDYVVSSGSGVQKLHTEMEREHPSYALGALSRTSGLGAYVGITEIAQPEPGETVVVGTATGGLGQIAGQLARLRGARTVGIAGSKKKCDFAVQELGYDACVSHKSNDFADELSAACPEGIDVYIETIGGNDLGAVLPLLNLHARMPIFGLMSMYAAQELPKGPDRTMLFLNQCIIKRLFVKGVVSNDYFQSHFGAFQRDMANWIRNGEIKVVEDVVDRLEDAPQALQDMFQTGNNLGKLVVRVGT